jgi:uncharacterized protein YllA (UPF0747 family)
MRGSLRHLSFRRLGTSDVHMRYLEEDPDLVPYLGRRPRDAKELLAHAPIGAARVLALPDLGRVLLGYAERHGAPLAARQSAQEVADGKQVVMVVTGQQPGLLGGPLYTLHKAATAVRLARDLQAAAGSAQTPLAVVPLFWNHTDDHDFDEVNRAFVVNQQQELQRLRLDIPHNGEAIRHLGVGHALAGVLHELRELLPETEFRDWAFELLAPRDPNESLGAGMARLLFALFGEQGMLVLEPRELPAPAFTVLEKWWRQGEKVRTSQRSTTEHFTAMGLDVGVDPGATLMFQIKGPRRVPLSDGDALPHSITDLSPGAILRPLWQDACLPTVAFVVGPGELAYLSLAGPLYRLLGVPKPAFVPRASLTLVEPSLSKLLAKFGWDLPDLAEGPEALVQKRMAGDQATLLERDLRSLTDMVERTLLDIVARAQGSTHAHEQGLASGIDKLRSKTVADLTKLADKLQNSRADQQGAGARQIRRLCASLRPRGRLQERVLVALPALVAHGPKLGALLVDAADPFAIEHGVLEL